MGERTLTHRRKDTPLFKKALPEKTDIKRGIKAIYDAIARRGATVPRSVPVSGGGELALALGYPPWFLDLLEEEHLSLFAGCGFPHAASGEGPRGPVLDLGCGAGFDALYAAETAKEEVVGLDFTLGLLKSAVRFSRRLGAQRVSFACGEAACLPFASGHFSLALANCVFSVVLDKGSAFREVFRVLSPGGRLRVCDIAATGHLPEELKNDPSAWAFCAGGALELSGYVGLAEAAGFTGVEARPLEEEQPLAGFLLSARKKR